MNIVNISYSLAKNRESIVTAAKRLKIDEQETQLFLKLYGLNTISIDLTITVDSLIMSAIRKCLATTSIRNSKIKYIIYAHTATHNTPFGKSILRTVQRELQLNQAISFGCSMNKCGSIFVAFQIAQQLFTKLSSEDYILIITGDVTFTEILQYIPGTTIMGDSACAVLLANSGDINKLMSIHVTIDGTYARGIWDNYDTKQLFELNYTHNLANTINHAILKANLTIEDIALILPHNVNTLSWYHIIKLLKINKDRVFLDNIPQLGHCFGSDPFINYHDAFFASRIKRQDYVLFATVGLGATYAAMIVQH